MTLLLFPMLLAAAGAGESAPVEARAALLAPARNAADGAGDL